MSEDTTAVRVERRGMVEWITITREERRNAINEAVIEGIATGLRTAAADREVRAIVLTGAGERAFSAGADLKPGATGSPFVFDPSEPRHPLVELFRLVERTELPIVARVNGHVRAGGMGLLCMCDLAIASDRATFGTPEVGIGLFPMMILPYMMRMLPRRKLLEMCITGEAFSADEAAAMGLVNYVVPADDLDRKVDWLLGRIVDKSPTAVRLGKYAFHAIQDLPIESSLAFTESNIRVVSMSDDAHEGMRAFVEKRPPRWQSR